MQRDETPQQPSNPQPEEEEKKENLTKQNKQNIVIEGLRKNKTFPPERAAYLTRPNHPHTHPLWITLVNIENPNNLDYKGDPVKSVCMCKVFWNKGHIGDVELNSDPVPSPLWRGNAERNPYTFPLKIEIDGDRRKSSYTSLRNDDDGVPSLVIPEMKDGRNELIIRVYDSTEVPCSKTNVIMQSI